MLSANTGYTSRLELGMLLRQVVFSYRALFGWIAPADYIMMKVVEPALQIVLFVLMGRFAGLDAEYLVIGNSMRLVATGGIFGMLSVALNERRARTLPVVIASATPSAQTFYARGFAQVIDGLASVVIGLAIGALFFGLDFSRLNWFWFLLACVVISFGVSGFGLLVGTTTLLGTEANLVGNLAFNALLLFCGVNFPVEALPQVWQRLTQLLPLTHGLSATRLLFDGQLEGVPGLLAIELLIGMLYAVVGYLLFAVVERTARAQGTLDLF